MFGTKIEVLAVVSFGAAKLPQGSSDSHCTIYALPTLLHIFLVGLIECIREGVQPLAAQMMSKRISWEIFFYRINAKILVISKRI
jgi:hypothetical protein